MKKVLIIVSLLLCMSLVLVGCGGSKETADSDSSNAQTDDGGQDIEEAEEIAEDSEDSEASDESGDDSSEITQVKDPGTFESISDFSDYWNDLYNSNEAVINAYEGMPIMELVTPGLCFVTGVQYDILNINNENGRFDGELMLAGYSGFEEKNGAQITFGYEDVLEEDGFTPSQKKDDKKVENGNCNLDKGYYFAEDFTERAGAKISRSTNEFIKLQDGMCALIVEGSTLNYRGEEELRTTYIFIRAGKDQYDFVVAKSESGTAFEVLKMEDDMTKEKAVAMFEAAGATLENSGGIADGKLVVDSQ